MWSSMRREEQEDRIGHSVKGYGLSWDSVDPALIPLRG
ncbi:hypothetical protein T4D_14180 [Trichinella pseudospiralis]|uniref:Uncharacterized protein n=1 Tax=Trichinella pseudospiralis TaxID=6337 RepID=A0A0V1DNG2_TRIPS|nr:hypothetical protein T4D_14180 [Trichinella pseudospiralis]